MKQLPIALGAALLASAALSACASSGRHGGPPGYYDAAGYNAYYDDAYGPFYDGYWDGDTFLYSRGKGRDFERDEGHHFQRGEGTGFHGVHGNVHAPAAAHAAPAAQAAPAAGGERPH